MSLSQVCFVFLARSPHFYNSKMVGAVDVAHYFNAHVSRIFAAGGEEILQRLGRVGGEVREDVDVGDDVQLRLGLRMGGDRERQRGERQDKRETV